jgi:hypothetical protein
MKKFKCKNCGAEFNVDDNVYDMLTVYCPCCGDIHSNLVINNFDYNKFVEESPYKLFKFIEEMKKSNDIYKSATDAVKKYEEERILKDTDKSVSGGTYDDYESEDKMVSHPSHYQSKKGIEVIDAIEAFTEDLEGIEAICTGNAIKYLCRWKNKNGIQDLEKAMWYLQHLINVLKSENKE